jgi:hypothetical protein
LTAAFRSPAATIPFENRPSRLNVPGLPRRRCAVSSYSPFGLWTPPPTPVDSVVVGINVRGPLPPDGSDAPKLSSDLRSPPGIHPLGIVALNPIRTLRACLSEKPDFPSLPACAAFYHMRRRLIVPGSLLSVRPAVP